MKILESYPIKTIENSNIPPLLREIPKPPKKLFVRGELPSGNLKYLAVVGSRKYTPYGKEACKKIIEGLRGYPIVIVSGLALGIDAFAHESALVAGLKTIAVPGSGLDESVIHPRTNLGLAKRILESGGTLLSEFDPHFIATPYSFPQRNRIMAGLSDAVLVIEAELKSGTLITSKLATEFNREVFAVPGSIFSSTSEGPHMLIRLGATPVTKSADVLEALGFEIDKKGANKKIYDDLGDDEKILVKCISSPLSRDEILEQTDWEPERLSVTITLLEIKGVVKESAGKIYLL